jgi:hypothetical protein
MSIIQGQIYSNTNQASLDAKYGPYESADEAFELLYADGDIAVGLTVGILNAETGKIEDYWFYGGTARENLVVKLRYDGTFLTVNGEAWQLNLDRPKCIQPEIDTYNAGGSPSDPRASGIPNEVHISSRTPGSTILYTKAMWDETAGAYEEVVTPTLETGIVYTGPITVTEGEKYKIVAVAIKEGWMNSNVSTPAIAQYVAVNIPEGSQFGGTEKMKDNGQIEF